MSDFKVLLLSMNIRAESMISPAIGLFSALLKREGFKVEMFDTTLYDMASRYADLDEAKRTNLIVRPGKADVRLKMTDPYEDFRKKTEEFKPDIICVSAVESLFFVTIDFLRRVDDLNIPVIVGGIFTTFAPEIALKFKEVDMICRGEGETAIVELCRRMRQGKDCSDIPNLWIKNKNGNISENPISSPVNMDENPLIDLGIFEEARFLKVMTGKVFRMIPVETDRGCPYVCTFCNSHAWDLFYKSQTGKRFHRKKSLAAVERELQYYYDQKKFDFFGFWADTFINCTDKEFDAFCEMYKKFRFPFWCQTRAETLSWDRVKKLKDLGLYRIDIGLEHGNEKFRRERLHRHCSNDDMVEKLKILNEYDIPYTVNNIIGFPDETRDLIMDTVELNRLIKSDSVRCSVLMPHHGTELRRYAVEKGYLRADSVCSIDTNEPVLNMPQISRSELKGLLKTFAMYVKFPKDRWPEIAAAEKPTPEGEKIHEKLREEYVSNFF
ncbi:MAG: radical SAM protein [Candidatus Pacebacteria bacterium]|nr:radical SAM protein [Candidatus Paceibacterota bacterium]